MRPDGPGPSGCVYAGLAIKRVIDMRSPRTGLHIEEACLELCLDLPIFNFSLSLVKRRISIRYISLSLYYH
jgi:hypothetical protein